ncbi:serine/threonine-protein kinase STY46 isoform X2 [Daucus carota subsp. sativus]|uniref:serine/threonine-protein kinase STY46 isoform X2 n=1 Tax=Daucus carota subsp. sativus TaxID=79200 RepID=UPI0007EFD5DD|nr:PREDICTED: serine/threonine-protein kinase STY46-like isoform X2 [Daucus carota subsp. sativus]
MDLIEGVGESSSPPRTVPSFGGYDIRNDVYNRLVEAGNQDFGSNTQLWQVLDSHFNSLPSSYALDINMDRVDDVLLHHKLLTLAKDSDNQLVFNVRLVETFGIRADTNNEEQVTSVLSTSMHCTDEKDSNKGIKSSQHRDRTLEIDFEPCSKLGDLNLDVKRNSTVKEMAKFDELFPERQEPVLVHEVIFSTVDKPKLLSQLSALLSDIGLNIREAHVFSTTDGYSLDVFVVDGWPVEDINDLHEAVDKAIRRSERSRSGSSHSQPAAVAQTKPGDWDIDVRALMINEKIATGSCADLFRGTYCGQDVAVKVLRSEHLNKTLEDEFAHEVNILREVQHRNVVRFIGSCTKSPNLCIVTEFMPGGSLYEYLHKKHTKIELSQLVKFAIDVCSGMEYLHQSNIIHRDLKAANLLMDAESVVKVADFGVARFQNQGGEMTAETGTYRWMAPEVINHLPYDHKADVFSFAIVLWELVTAKVPYDTMTPLQAALGVRQGLRPDIPKDAPPKLVELMQKCWEASPSKRPSFSEIKIELEKILEESRVGFSGSTS